MKEQHCRRLWPTHQRRKDGPGKTLENLAITGWVQSPLSFIGVFSIAAAFISAQAAVAVPIEPPLQIDPSAGQVEADGSIKAGIIPQTGRVLYTTKEDAEAATWEQAGAYCQTLNAHRHKDWRLPNADEIGILYNNQKAIGGFRVAANGHPAWYWTLEEGRPEGFARIIDFGRGMSYVTYKDENHSVRCVRSP